MKLLTCAWAAVRFALSAWPSMRGAPRAANSAMMVTTTSISISVIPLWDCLLLGDFIVYIATSLMPVIASIRLKISVPTIKPITKMISGSKSEVKRRIEVRVSLS